MVGKSQRKDVDELMNLEPIVIGGKAEEEDVGRAQNGNH